MTGARTAGLLPYGALLALAVTRLAWTPATFWAATPRELDAVLGPVPAAGPPDRAGLAALMARFPDTAGP